MTNVSSPDFLIEVGGQRYFLTLSDLRDVYGEVADGKPFLGKKLPTFLIDFAKSYCLAIGDDEKVLRGAAIALATRYELYRANPIFAGEKTK